MSERIVWRTAQPLWSQLGAGAPAPAVLRFASDDFMERFAASVACDGAGLAPLVAGRETWRDPGAGLDSAYAADPSDPIPLFQPTHGRFYLVTASLVCRRYGHPDRAVDAGADESVAYVLRRLEPTGDDPVDPVDPATYIEHGWTTAIGDGAWIEAPNGRLVADEQRLPLFPVTARCGAGKRRLHAGLLPVARREAFESSPPRPTPEDIADTDDPLGPSADPRLAQLEPLIVALQQLRAAVSQPPPLAVLRESLFYTMVDLAHWLDAHLPAALEPGSTLLGLDRTYGTVGGVSRSWAAALRLARDAEPDVSFDDGTPAIVDLSRTTLRERASLLLFGRDHTHGGDDDTAPSGTQLFVAARDALPVADATADAAAADADVAAAAGDAAAGQPEATAAATTTPGGVYVARFVHERPHCRPAERLVLSAPSRVFRFAPFHDPDAPGRPVRIALPIDTSPGGLRRFPKNVSVVLSSELRKQMAQVSEKTLQGDGVDDPPTVSFGMLCQLSIPIITICALILLMVIVSLLNIVFFWLPLFKICLPLPKGDGS